MRPSIIRILVVAAAILTGAPAVPQDRATTLIVPSHDLVVVRLGHYKGSEPGARSFGQALGLLMEAVPRQP